MVRKEKGEEGEKRQVKYMTTLQDHVSDQGSRKKKASRELSRNLSTIPSHQELVCQVSRSGQVFLHRVSFLFSLELTKLITEKKNK